MNSDDFSPYMTSLELDWEQAFFGGEQHNPDDEDFDGYGPATEGPFDLTHDPEFARILQYTANFTAEDLISVAEFVPSNQLAMCCSVSAHHRAVLTPIIYGRGFGKLPNEVLVNIAEFLPKSDLLRFARISRHISQICIRVIYGDVDLSIHNRGRVAHGPLEDSTELSHYSSSWWCTDVPANALTKQEKFLLQILQHPDYATYVMSLSWTLLILKEPNWNADNPYPLLGTDAKRKLIDRPIWHIWKVFSMLTNVRTLDLAYLSRDYNHPLASKFPDALFPNATAIRLSGAMQYGLAASILAANPAKMECLIWDNVQQPPRDRFLYHQATQRQAYHQQNLASWNNLPRFQGDANDYFSVPGPMHNLLGSLAGRCTNLRCLTLRKTGEIGIKHSRDRSEFSSFYSSQDEDMYAEWAVFLKSQKHTLQRLELEQGPKAYHFPDRSRAGPPGLPLVTDMDDRFERIIWPVLMHQQGDWPCLAELSILGVEYWHGKLRAEEEVKRTLRSKFGRELSVYLDPKGEVMDHIGMV